MDKGIIYSDCLKKKRYMTEEDVEFFKKRIKKKKKKKLRSYKCPHCKGYHLTSKLR